MGELKRSAEEAEHKQSASGWQKLLAVQRDLPAVLKARTQGHNGLYLSLPDLLTAVRPVLTQHGIVLSQEGEVYDGQIALVTRLTNAETGESIVESGWLLKDAPQGKMNANQALGSSSTYARRYSLMAVLGIIGDDDDPDGQGAPPRGSAKAAKPPPRTSATSFASAQEIEDFTNLCECKLDVFGKEAVRAICRKHTIGSDRGAWKSAHVAAATKELNALADNTPPQPATEQ